MPCCESPAVAKTSINGLQFFAHKSGECATAPETIWHKASKLLIEAELRKLGITPILENAGPDWRADIYFEFCGRKVAIEIQHSYQHRNKFSERQSRYGQTDVEAYWLLIHDVYGTFVKTEQLERIRVEHGGKIPPKLARCRPDIPIAYLELDPVPMIKGAGFFQCRLDNWILGILEQRFVHNGDFWHLIEAE